MERTSSKTGTNADDKAPSPNMRLNKFGIVNAMMNAELTIPLPSAEKSRTSRKSPRILEKTVETEREDICLRLLEIIFAKIEKRL